MNLGSKWLVKLPEVTWSTHRDFEEFIHHMQSFTEFIQMPAFSCERVWVKDVASILRKLSIPSLDKAFMSALEHGGTVPYWKNNNGQKKSWYPRRIGYAIKHMLFIKENTMRLWISYLYLRFIRVPLVPLPLAETVRWEMTWATEELSERGRASLCLLVGWYIRQTGMEFLYYHYHIYIYIYHTLLYIYIHILYI